MVLPPNGGQGKLSFAISMTGAVFALTMNQATPPDETLVVLQSNMLKSVIILICHHSHLLRVQRDLFTSSNAGHIALIAEQQLSTTR